MNLTETVRTTTFRWSLAIAGALLLESALLCGAFYLLTARHAVAVVNGRLAADCRSIQTLPRQAIIADIRRRLAADVHRFELVGLFAKTGEPLAGNIATMPKTLATTDSPAVVGLIRSEPPDPQPNPSLSIACRTLDGDRLIFARDTDELDYISALTQRALITVSFPLVLISAALGLFLARRAQTRFDRVQAAIDDVMAGNLGMRLPTQAPVDPFGRLSRAVHVMLDRLETALDDSRCLGDDIAHELRTPLTRLRAGLERGCVDAASQSDFREVGERAIREIDHALSIVSAILRIRAIEEATRGSEFKPVDLKVLVHDATELYRPTAEDKHISISVDADHPATIVADRDLLMEAVCNLIDNAIKFTPSGGRVLCSLQMNNSAAPVLQILDNGSGIAADERAAVLRRFHRGKRDSAAEGHGIGLSLVAAIVRLHGFKFELRECNTGCDAVIICGDV